MWIQTRDRKAFDLIVPRPEDVAPDVIATVLGRTIRFGGHCGPAYNNAQHSALVASHVPENQRLAALLHDAHEVYSPFGDVLAPGYQLDPYVTKFVRALHARIDYAIAARFGLAVDEFTTPQIREADARALATELRDVMRDPPREWAPLPPPYDERIVCWSTEWARVQFLEMLSDCWEGGTC